MGRWIPPSSSSSLLLSRIKRASQSLLHLPTHTPSSPPSLLSSLQHLRPISTPFFQSWGLRFLSANPCPSTEEEDFVRGVSGFEQNYGLGGRDLVEEEEEEERGKIPVKAYFLCTSIDLKSMQAENWSNVVPFTSRSSNYIALRYYDFPPELVFGCSDEIGAEENWSCCRYMVVFQYGSTVLFNIEEDEVDSYLDIVRRHASGLLSEMKRDDYAVKEKPLMMEEMLGRPDYIVLKSLDIDAMRIVGSVLGQSIALDYFVSQVDGVLEVFTDINRGMEETGNFTMRRKKLFQLVGKANSNLADVIIKVGIFDRSEIAWKDAKYAQILEYLREEYEVTQRFGNLDFKLKFVEHNIHFLQEVLQNRKSDLLVWCMIILLGIQDVVMVLEIIHDSATNLPG